MVRHVVSYDPRVQVAIIMVIFNTVLGINKWYCDPCGQRGILYVMMHVVENVVLYPRG